MAISNSSQGEDQPVAAKIPPLTLDGSNLTLNNLVQVARRKRKVLLSKSVDQPIESAYQFVKKVVAEKQVVYGITTGFGDLSNILISAEDATKLQTNLVRSHAAGAGPLFHEEVVRAIMLLQVNKLAHGNSGVSPQLVGVILDCLNAQVHPLIPSQGSVGASGDLAPLAHAAQVYIGDGRASVDGNVVSGKAALSLKNIKPATLGPKSGLALLNGTEVTTALAALAVHDAQVIANSSLVAGAMSLEALRGSDRPFHEAIHGLRPHPGQIKAAEGLRRLLRDSKITISHPGSHKVQDPYSLRCMPQVVGASYTAIDHCKEIVEIELNSVTDNPLIFAAAGTVLSGGNFHAQPLALAMDYLKTAVAEIANISERRTYLLLDGHRSGLPNFLAEKPGLESGLMISQNLAAALVSENKVLAHPASVDSIPTSAGMEDHVSMAPIAARQAIQIIENACIVIAIELLAASQGLFLSKPLDPGKGVKQALALVRRVTAPLKADRSVSQDIEQLSGLIKSGVFSQLLDNGNRLHSD